MSFTSASTDPYRAAALADQDHVSYWMQVERGRHRPDRTRPRRVVAG